MVVINNSNWVTLASLLRSPTNTAVSSLLKELFAKVGQPWPPLSKCTRSFHSIRSSLRTLCPLCTWMEWRWEIIKRLHWEWEFQFFSWCFRSPSHLKNYTRRGLLLQFSTGPSSFLSRCSSLHICQFWFTSSICANPTSIVKMTNL